MKFIYPAFFFLAAIVFILTPSPVESGNGAVAVACPEPASKPHYDPGVTDEDIRLGATMPLSGPASLFGRIAIGEKAYFDYINKTQGGENGREIKFEIEDDAFNTLMTVTKTKKLIEEDKVFLMFGSVGSLTQLAVRDYLNDKEVPQLFVATGLTTFSADYDSFSFTMGWQPTYQSETRIYAQSVVANHPDAKIGVLYDDTVEGKDYVVGLKEGLGSNLSMIVAEQSYPLSNSGADVLAALQNIKKQGADTIFLFTSPQHSIFALVRITLLGWTPNIYLNAVSNLPFFMGIAAANGAALQNVTSLGFLKDPNDSLSDDEGMLLYKQFLQTNCGTCNVNDPLFLYGVAAAYTMADVLDRAGSNLTRCNVTNVAANHLQEKNHYANPSLIPGVWVKTTPSDHFPITQGQLITWSGTRWVSEGDIMNGTIKLGDAEEEIDL